MFNGDRISVLEDAYVQETMAARAMTPTYSPDLVEGVTIPLPGHLGKKKA